MSGALLIPGVCQFCDCCPEKPCSVCRLRFDDCAFHDDAKLCCSADACVRRWEQERREAIEKARAENRRFIGEVAARWRKSDEAQKAKRERLFKRVSRRRAA